MSAGPALGPDGIGYFGNWVNNRIFKFDYNTGAVLGTFLTNHFCEKTPAYINPTTIVYGSSGTIFGIDTTIMDFNWFMQGFTYTTGSPNIGPDGDVVFTTSNGNAYRIHPVSGGNVWTKPGFGFPDGMMVFTRDDSKVVFSHDMKVTALNYSDGSQAWSTPFPSTMAPAGVAPNGTICVGGRNGVFYGLDPSDGHILWQWATLDQIFGAPAFSPDGTMAYIGSVDNRLYAIRVADGTRAWSFTTSLWVQTPPAIGADGSIYVHNKGGDLYRISPAGVQVWMVHLLGESRGPMTIGPDGTLYVGYTGSNQNMGLAMVRQQALSLQPLTVVAGPGFIVSGGPAELASSDDTYVRYSPTGSSVGRIPVRTEITTLSPYPNVSQLKLTVEGRSSGTGLTRVVELFNYGANKFVIVASGAETAADSTMNINVVNPQVYVKTNGEIKMRVTWNASNAGSARLTTSLDQVRFLPVPVFQP